MPQENAPFQVTGCSGSGSPTFFEVDCEGAVAITPESTITDPALSVQALQSPAPVFTIGLDGAVAITPQSSITVPALSVNQTGSGPAASFTGTVGVSGAVTISDLLTAQKGVTVSGGQLTVQNGAQFSGGAVTIDAPVNTPNLTLATDNAGGPGPGLVLRNTGGTPGAQAAMYFQTCGTDGEYDAAIVANDDGNYSNSIQFWTRQPGSGGPSKVNHKRMVVSSGGGVTIFAPDDNTTPALSVNGTVTISEPASISADTTGSTPALSVNQTGSGPAASFIGTVGVYGTATISDLLTAQNGVTVSGGQLTVQNGAQFSGGAVTISVPASISADTTDLDLTPALSVTQTGSGPAAAINGGAVTIDAPAGTPNLTLTTNNAGKPGPGLVLRNTGEGPDAQASIFFQTCGTDGEYDAAIVANDDGNYSNSIQFWTRQPGSGGPSQVNHKRMVINSGGGVTIFAPDDNTTPALIVQGSFPGVNPNTSSPNGLLQIIGYVAGYLGNYGYLNSSGHPGTASDLNIYTSIWASNRIVCNEFDAVSDSRLKENTAPSDARRDSETLSKLKVTDYNFIDRIGHGDTPRKKLIAQQVRETYPDAVRPAGRGFIPDHYQPGERTEFLGASRGLVVTTRKEHGFEPGDRILILHEKGGEECSVREVRDEKTFVVPAAEDWGAVFVYGKEVDDLLAVDYAAISMLNVSATQDILRRLKNVESKLDVMQADRGSARRENST